MLFAWQSDGELRVPAVRGEAAPRLVKLIAALCVENAVFQAHSSGVFLYPENRDTVLDRARPGFLVAVLSRDGEHFILQRCLYEFERTQ